MLRSMTGYGRGEAEGDASRFTVEIKSVNHRYCDIALRIPRELSVLEEQAKRVIKGYVSRGRVDAAVSLEETSAGGAGIALDRPLAQGYIDALRELADMGLRDDTGVSTLARFPHLFVEKGESQPEEVWPLLERALVKALNQLVASREREGETLSLDLKERLASIDGHGREIASRAPAVVEEYRQRLRDQVEKILPEYPALDERLNMEVVVLAEKSSITEELVRLRSHVEAFCQAMNQGGAVGRKLDFIVQEINRETNTISAKANDYEIARRVVEIKSQAEKIREQVQNIE